MATAQKRLHWRKLSIFIALTAAWSCSATGLLYVAREWLPGVGAELVIVGAYSFTPLLSALIADRGWVKKRLRGPTRRTLSAYVLLPVFVFLAFILCLFVLTYLLGNMSPMNEVGVVPLVLGAIIAGWTFYGVFGIGEEYGWRGFLWEELRPLGIVGANVTTGMIWGLWHMPLVLSTYTYGSVGWVGVVAIACFTIAMSFILSALREATGSIIPSAALHGMINGASYLNAVMVIPGNTLIGGLGGIVASFVMMVLGVAMWLYVDRRTALVHY